MNVFSCFDILISLVTIISPLCKIIHKSVHYHLQALQQILSPHIWRHGSLWACWLLHTQPFNCPLSGTPRVSQYQKGKTNLDLTEARDSEWQWHQLGHMQVCTSLQTDNHTSTHHSVFYRLDALPAAQPTASKHWRHFVDSVKCMKCFWISYIYDSYVLGEFY